MWAARDEDGDLCLFINKPKRIDYYWYSQKDTDVWCIPYTLFPNLTWDDEPLKVELIPVLIDE